MASHLSCLAHLLQSIHQFILAEDSQFGRPIRRVGERLAAAFGRIGILDRSAAAADSAQARPRVLLMVFLAVGGLGLVADQAGKGWAFAPSSEPADLPEIAPGILAGAQGRNYGTMFSLDGAASPSLPQIVPTLVGFIAVGMLIRGAFLDRDRWRPIHAIGGGLVFAGAVGNQIDRLVLGYVRDYLILRLHPQGIFNTADVFMVVGVLLLLVGWTARRRPASVSLQPGLISQ